jgi:hypothetical protein
MKQAPGKGAEAVGSNWPGAGYINRENALAMLPMRAASGFPSSIPWMAGGDGIPTPDYLVSEGRIRHDRTK